MWEAPKEDRATNEEEEEEGRRSGGARLEVSLSGEPRGRDADLRVDASESRARGLGLGRSSRWQRAKVPSL